MPKLKILEDIENSFTLLKYYIWKLQKENCYLKRKIKNLQLNINEVIASSEKRETLEKVDGDFSE